MNHAHPPRDYLRYIYVDSLTHDDSARRLAVDLLGPDHMMLGSDLPFDMGDADPVASVEGTPGLDEAGRRLVLGETAARLLRVA